MYLVKCQGDAHAGRAFVFWGFVFVFVTVGMPAGWSAERPEPFDPISSLYEKGNEYFRRGAYSSAVSVFQLVYENHPEHVLAPESLFSVASVKHKMGDHRASRAAYEDLLKKFPAASAVSDALLQLGSECLELGDVSMAESVWNRLIKEYRGSIAARIAQQRLHSVKVSSVPMPVAPERPMASHPPSSVQDVPVPPESKSFMPVSGHPAVYKVKKGDSLSKIAKTILGSKDRYKELAKYNKIPPPYTISVGQEIKIPGGAPSSKGGAFAAPSMQSLPEKKPLAQAAPSAPAPPAWDPMPMEAMEKAAGSIEKWVDNRAEGYESLQTRLLELQNDVRGQKVMEKQVEILKAHLEAEQKQNSNLKQEVIQQIERLKEMKDRNTTLLSQVEGMTNSVERTRADQTRLADLDEQIRAYREKMDSLQKQNEILSETMDKMRNAYDAQMTLVKAYYDSQLVQARQAYELRLDTTATELERLRVESRQKEENLNVIKKDYTDLMKKTATIQKEVFEERQSRVSLVASKQALEKAQDLRRAGKIKESEAAYKDALNLYPESADAMNGLAYLYAEDRRDLDEAEKLIERAIAVDPQGRGYYLDTLGWIHYIRTAYAAALDVLHEAYQKIPVEDLPARAAVSFHIGKVYQAMSDKDKAFFHFIDAIKLAPRTRWASLSERELDTL